MEGNDVLERNWRFVIAHFDDFVNKKHLEVIDRNMAADVIDHDGPGGKPADRAGDRAMMKAMYGMFSRPSRNAVLLQRSNHVIEIVDLEVDARSGTRLPTHPLSRHEAKASETEMSFVVFSDVNLYVRSGES